MAKPYQALRDQLFSPAQQAEHATEAQQLLEALPLGQLRQALQYTQSQLASLLDISQPAVTQMEKQTDMLIGTLRTYVEAMGGQLELRARFPQGDVVITQFAAQEAPGAATGPAKGQNAPSPKRRPKTKLAG